MSTPWHADETFWRVMESVLFPADRIAQAEREVEEIVSLLHIGSSCDVLDVPCGVGRHSLEFARRGHRVVAVDRTARYLERARNAAKAEGVSIEFLQADMVEFSRHGAFDLVINLFTSIGYSEDPEDDYRIVGNAYRSLKSGGFFIIDAMGKEVLARIFQKRDWHEADGVVVLEERAIIGGWTRVESKLIVMAAGTPEIVRMSLRLYSGCELIGLLKKCGFENADVYGDLTGSPYDENAKRLVAVARK